MWEAHPLPSTIVYEICRNICKKFIFLAGTYHPFLEKPILPKAKVTVFEAVQEPGTSPGTVHKFWCHSSMTWMTTKNPFQSLNIERFVQLLNITFFFFLFFCMCLLGFVFFFNSAFLRANACDHKPFSWAEGLRQANVKCFCPQILPGHTHSSVDTNVPAVGSGSVQQCVSSLWQQGRRSLRQPPLPHSLTVFVLH